MHRDRHNVSLADIVRKLGDLNYNIGRPIYFDSGDEEYQPIEVHAKPVWEIGKPDLIQRILSEKKSNDAGIAITYGGFLGIDIAAANNAEGVLLLDINPEQKHFWRSVITLLKECPDVDSFNARFSIVEQRYNLRDPKKEDPDGAYPSFVRSEEVYQKVRHWALKDMIASTDMDVMDTQRHKALAALLRQEKQEVKLIYLSNIPHFFMMRDGADSWTGKTHFYGGSVKAQDYSQLFANQKIIADGNTKVIHSIYNETSGQFHLQVNPLRDLPAPLAIAM